MKTAILALGLALGQVYANIPFPKPELRCDGGGSCFRGMPCVAGKCIWGQRTLGNDLSARSLRRSEAVIPKELQARATYSADGTCGAANGGTICNPNFNTNKGDAYTGACCSSYGYCGNSAAHCGTGCQSGCTTPPAPTNPTAPRPDGLCGSQNGGATCDFNGPYGGCCSSYGYCGKTADHCGAGCQNGCNGVTGTTPNPTTTKAATSSSSQEPILGVPTTGPVNGPVTTDGTCGAANGGTVCGNWAQGSCCSAYGFCGKTTAHCDEGCQSGPCTGTPGVPVPGPNKSIPQNSNPGSLALAPQGAGVPAMHAGLMSNGTVIFLDKVEETTQIGKFNTKDNPNSQHQNQYAYSALYDPITNSAPKRVGYSTNAFCSGGAFLADGRFISVGGNAPLDFIDPTVGNGFKSIRTYNNGDPDWDTKSQPLTSERWYASVQIMPDATLFVASGSLTGLDPTEPSNNNPTYEILTAQGLPNGKQRVDLEILRKNQPYYMYPFIHLLNNGQLFIAVSKSAEVFNVATNAVTKALPDIPGDYRTYPNTGGSVLLPLSSQDGYAPEVMICGGGAYQDITSPTDPSCGRMRPLDAAPKWEMDSMPEGRGMVEGTLLPDGTIIWLNGAQTGAQGFGIAKNPAYEVLIYDPKAALGKRFTTGPVSGIARLYHSVALLLLDGTLMIAGSNPVEQPKATPTPGKVPSEDYVTEYRVGIYTPPYLSGANASKRPTGMTLSTKAMKADGSTFTVKFTAPAGNKAVKVSLYHGGFVTHSLHMGHRMIFLDTTGYQAGATSQTLTVKMPPNRNVAPPGPYVVYVTVDSVPAVGQSVMVS